MQLSEIVAVLRGIPLFASLGPSKLKLLAFSSDYLRLDTGEVLFLEGDRADNVYLIDEGDVDMERALSILKKNEFDGVIVPDHTPEVSCAAPWHACGPP